MHTAKLTLTRGLPASGKSTWAQQQVDANPDTTVRVNRDDIRTELFGWEYHNGGLNHRAEKIVTLLERYRVEEALRDGKHVISDNTYLRVGAIQSMVDLAKTLEVPVEIVMFDVSLEECKRRNAARGTAGGREVPEHVMESMAEKSYDEHGKLIVCQIDEKNRVTEIVDTPR